VGIPGIKIGDRSGEGSNWTWIKGQCHENAMKNGIRKDDCSNKHGLRRGKKFEIHT
jgi:hypothetical protein